MRVAAALFGCLLAGAGGGWAHAQPAPPFSRLEFLGEARLPTGMSFEGTEVGGLSSLTYDAERGVYYALADDGSERSPARFYTLLIEVEDGMLGGDDVRVEAVTTLRELGAKSFAKGTLDPEGLVLTPAGRLLLSSEGPVRDGVAPFVRELTLQGFAVRSFALPERFLPGEGGRRGVRHNKAFEALTLTPDGTTVWTANESTLEQDGAEASLEAGGAVRLLSFELETTRPGREVVYRTEPLFTKPTPPTGHQVSGLVELLALSGEEFLALERAYVEGVGFRLRLFRVSIRGADDVSGLPSLAGRWETLIPAAKELLLDFEELDRTLDNVEGMSWGPNLADGRRTLLFVSDNNFSPSEITQFFAFAVDTQPATIAGLQGRSHRLGAEPSWVWGLEGVLTAFDPKARTVWVEDAHSDDDPATSNSLAVTLENSAAVARLATHAGRHVALSGRLVEKARPGALPVTTLEASAIELLPGSSSLSLEALGEGGRAIPKGAIDDDALSSFEPESDGLDFWESLEGMRVSIENAVVVGPTDSHGSFTVLADLGRGSKVRSSRGGLMLSEGDTNPERLLVDAALLPERPALAVGDHFDGSLVGVIDYRFGAYRLLPASLPPVVPGGPERERTSLKAKRRALTVASFNLENFSATSPAEKCAALGRVITESLGGPDLLAAQEVQDDSGPANDGVVSAEKTLAALAACVVEAGGPRYQFGEIPPVNNTQGGAPGGNIRVALLWNPKRVKLEGELAQLAPDDPCFGGDPARGYEPSRRPLVGSFRFGRQRLTVVNNHWNSKGGDDRLFGAVQPPVARSEAQRLCIAERVGRWVEGRVARDPEAAVIVLGDLNEHETQPPIHRLEQLGLTDLLRWLPAEDRYTYIFEGNAAVLDHLLVTPVLADSARTEIDIVHSNADYPASNRASDHDALVARFRF